MIIMTNLATILTVQSMAGITEECHTYAHWQELGRQVRKGEHAAFMAPMWKPSTKKNEEGEEITNGRFFAKNSAFFKLSQTDPIEEKKTA
jgi:antirestriction protein ArdC